MGEQKMTEVLLGEGKRKGEEVRDLSGKERARGRMVGVSFRGGEGPRVEGEWAWRRGEWP